jgi:hypothetical protein
MICHDNSAHTGQRVWVPWNQAFLGYWQGNTHLKYLGFPAEADTGTDPGFGFGGGPGSTSDRSGAPFPDWAADIWTSGKDQPITGIQWWGSMLTQSDTRTWDWTFRIYDDNQGPGTELWSCSVGAGDVAMMPTDQANAYGEDVFEYFTKLPEADWFAAQEGSTYWLHISPATDDANAWGWHSGPLGAGGRAVGSQDGQNWVPLGYDLAFDFTTTAIPEPCAALLVVAGLVGLALRR